MVSFYVCDQARKQKLLPVIVFRLKPIQLKPSGYHEISVVIFSFFPVIDRGREY